MGLKTDGAKEKKKPKIPLRKNPDKSQHVVIARAREKKRDQTPERGSSDK